MNKLNELNMEGCYASRRLPDGRVMAVMELTFGRARLTIGKNTETYDDGY
jgi:hypothetical protein